MHVFISPTSTGVHLLLAQTHTLLILYMHTHTVTCVQYIYMYMYTPGLMMTTKKCLDTLEILDEKFNTLAFESAEIGEFGWMFVNFDRILSPVLLLS